jgi:tetratricopeptide (TPR) repeat protein
VARMTGEAMAMLGVEDSELYASLMQLGAYALERMGQAAELRRAAETLYGIADRTGSDQIRLEAMRAESLWLSNYSLDQAACAEMRLRMSEGNERLGQPFAAMEAMSDAADSLVRVGAVKRARPIAEEAVARARRLQGEWAALATYPVLMELLVATGEFAEIDSMFRELRPFLGEIPASGRALQMLSAKAAADQWRGIHTIDIAQVGSHVDPQGWREMQFITRIWSLWETGMHEEARTLLDQVAPIIPTEGEGMRWFINAYPFVYYYNLFGDPERASAWTGAMARHPEFCLPGGQARLELARTALLMHQLDSAACLLDEAVAHYEREGMRPLLALAWMEQARLGFARGEVSSARALLDRAESLFATLTMTPWVARVRALRREARLPA